MIEAYFTPINEGNVISPYHALVFALGMVSGFDRNIRIWLANALNYSVAEDIFYWAFKGELPYSWGSEYIVFHHIPLYYIPYLALTIILYKKGLKHDKARVQS
jgi:hypothetical protein